MKLKIIFCLLLLVFIIKSTESQENNLKHTIASTDYIQALKDVPTYFVCGTNDGLLKLGDRIAETKMVVIH